MTRFLTLEHVPVEGPGKIADWIGQQQGVLMRHQMYTAQDVPPPGTEFDALIIMGGPMGVSDHEAYPWLNSEIKWIRQVIASGKHVLGICLGAQLIARALGAAVQRNAQQEIGWFPIQLTEEFQGSGAGAGQALAATQPVLHWHGDTFDLPEGSTPVASSAGCRNQGFVYDRHVLALQFHLEIGPLEIEPMIQEFGHQLVADDFVQPADVIREETRRHEKGAQENLSAWLTRWLYNLSPQ